MLDEKEETVSPSNRMWSRVCVLFLAFAVVAAVFTVVGLYAEPFARSTAKPDPPHIIFMLIDDMGWNDVSFHGSPQIPTPNLDALAASGIILNSYYTHPQCTPSRGALLSGKYANRIGLQLYVIMPSQTKALPLDVVTLPQHLKKLGYSNHIIGKWHLGYQKKAYLPTRRGFDSFFGYLNGFIDYYDYTFFGTQTIPLHQTMSKHSEENGGASEEIAKDENTPGELTKPEEKPYLVKYEELGPTVFGIDLWENETVINDFRGEYATDVFTEKAIDVITEHNATQPLFLFFSHLACHTGNFYMPLQATPERVARNKHIKDIDRRTYAGVVSALDDSVGKIFQTLHEKQMLEKSIIILTSDNGGPANKQRDGMSSNWPLRGMKHHLWEGGVRAAALIWSPLFHLQQPRTSNQLMHVTDWLPTLYHVAGGEVKDLGDIDGVDMWATLSDESLPSLREEILLHSDPIFDMAALRQGDMKILFGAYPAMQNEWYGPTGEEDNMTIESMDAWVWKNGSVVKDILVDTGQWLIVENDTWRESATLVCGENFFPETGKCDIMKEPCLYNITNDPCEFRNLAGLYPEVVDAMMERLKVLNASSVPPLDTAIDLRGYPTCHDFSFVPWLEENEISDCPWL